MMNDTMTTAKGFKLFEMNTITGELFPLFIGAKKATPIGEWAHAEYIPTKGFAKRGGWHLGADVPDAPWLKGLDGSYRSKRGKKFKRVWCECTYNATVDYNADVAAIPEKCFSDRVPENGYYFFREVGKGVWVISSDVRVDRVLSEGEVSEVMASKGYDATAAFAPYKAALEKKRLTNEAKKVSKKLAKYHKRITLDGFAW